MTSVYVEFLVDDFGDWFQTYVWNLAGWRESRKEELLGTLMYKR